MPRATLESKTSSELATETFDFASRLPAGESISSASVAISVFSGSDNAPGERLSGVASISGTQVLQKVTGGTVGAIYTLTATIHTSGGQILTMAGYLPVVSA